MRTDSKRCCTELILKINVSSPVDAMNFDELVVDYKYGIGAEQHSNHLFGLCAAHFGIFADTMWRQVQFGFWDKLNRKYCD